MEGRWSGAPARARRRPGFWRGARQDIELPGQQVAEMIIAELAGSLLQLDQRVHGLDQQIAATFRRHHQAMTTESMPGFGPILGAQLLRDNRTFSIDPPSPAAAA